MIAIYIYIINQLCFYYVYIYIIISIIISYISSYIDSYTINLYSYIWFIYVVI